MIVSESLTGCAVDGRLIAGYTIVYSGVPVFVGTFTECAMYGTATIPTGGDWQIRDARGLALTEPSAVWSQ